MWTLFFGHAQGCVLEIYKVPIESAQPNSADYLIFHWTLLAFIGEWDAHPRKRDGCRYAS